MNPHKVVHPDLLVAQKLAYETHGLLCTNLAQEAESQEYGACTFDINRKRITFRVAKITPTKIGQFVTLWKRVKNSPIMPFDMADPIDFFVVSVRNNQNFGQFIFPKNILWQKGFVSQEGNGGKRAMRIYPPWDMPNSPQAQKTQAWQLLYFVEMQPNMDSAKIKKLFS